MAAKKAPKLVGLDIGTSGVRAVELTWDRKTSSYRIKKAASVELPRGAVRNGSVHDEAVVAKALKRLWRKGHFSTRKVVMGLADNSLLTRQVDLPWMPPDDFRTALKYQVGDALPVDLDSVQIDYHLLGERHSADEHGQAVDLNRILIVAVSTDAVTSQANAVRKARLEPIGADTTAFALIRAACAGVLPGDTSTHAVVDLGADQLMVVVHRAGQPRFVRTISNLGGESATDALAARLVIDLDEAEGIKCETGLNGRAPLVAPIVESSVFGGVSMPVAASVDSRTAAAIEVLNPWATTIIGEVRNSLDYFQASEPGTPVKSLTLTGRTASTAGLVDRIATQIPIPVRTMPPLLGLEAARSVVHGAPPDTRLMVAAGLAMAGSS